jgi:hypothetical protein
LAALSVAQHAQQLSASTGAVLAHRAPARQRGAGDRQALVESAAGQRLMRAQAARSSALARVAARGRPTSAWAGNALLGRFDDPRAPAVAAGG